MDKTEAIKIEINAILYNITHKKVVLTAILRTILMDKINEYAQQGEKEIAKEAYMAGKIHNEYSDTTETFRQWWKKRNESNQEERK